MAALALAVVLFGLFHFFSQFWWPLEGATISVNDAVVPDARLYRLSLSRSLMIYAPARNNGRSWYVIRVSEKRVGWMADGKCLFVLPEGILVKDHPDPSVSLDSPKMNKHDAQLLLSDRSADFVGIEGERIHLEWR
jgi:hypothetical protein